MQRRNIDKRGKLIVIDGSDGVGKATQTKLLVSRLRKDGVPVETMDFPQYKQNLFGALLKECLSGKRGDFIALDPRVASVLYAADRFESKKKIEGWLSQGKVVILDRYVSSNQMHQGGKIRSEKERKSFLTWLEKMEYSVFGLPKPDQIVYLHLPTELSLRLLDARGGKDLAEKNIKYLSDARASALKLIRAHTNWKKIVCSNTQGIFSREIIHAQVYDVVRNIIGV